jgi:peptide deformylase
MTTILPIAQLGNPVLRDRATPIEDPEDPDLHMFIDNLLATLQESKGVGIAAPQVSKNFQLLIVASHPNARYPRAPQMEPLVLMNPRILAHSAETNKDWEGCLSIPGLRGLVSRYQEVEIEFCDLKGNWKRQVFTDFVARIFQHEFDHLEGLMFLDRVETTYELMAEQEYQQRIVQAF